MRYADGLVVPNAPQSSLVRLWRAAPNTPV